ncbi:MULTISPECIES: NUDIX hydrolase [Amycolatopsis]|uniref:NUDIX domain-containing protein n=1 Tax=Amycolatopsis dendrobii TaxID=2760662 RepID=A0A7W3VZA8_9PSEU|nr:MULTISPECIES: NUDIX domain-containing protein [Amycolatopsis]MBB1155890.1 NUDIX domain-containing protein [Amycolatopsis dendrobii]UKD53089.1 NUDIX domain-containing protein [Amycolatopsis sp. FU40]
MAEPTVEVADGVVFPQPLPDTAGGVVLGADGRAFVQFRSPDRPRYPSTWDVVSGHLEPGETTLDALAREVFEETGWRLRRVAGNLGRHRWPLDDGEEIGDFYLIEVEGDLARPVLEWDKHPHSAWFGKEDLDRLLVNCAPGDTLIRDVVAAALSVHNGSTGETPG